MKYKQVSGIELSIISLGTVPFGTEIKETDSFNLLDFYLEAGGNFIDTANIYADWIPGEKGMSEKTIGRWLKSRKARDKIIIGTKGGHPVMDGKCIPRLSLAELTADLDESLRRLQTDYIDIYWLHRDDPGRPAEEIVSTLVKLVGAGKIRCFGCSNWTSRRIRAVNDFASRNSVPGFIANQAGWSLADQNPESLPDTTMLNMDSDSMKFHLETKLALAAYSSQAKGFFSGKYAKEGKLPPTMSADTVKRWYFSDLNFERLQKARELAEEKSRTSNQIALAYLINHPFPVFPVVGCRNRRQLDEAISAADIVLTKEEVAYLGN